MKKASIMLIALMVISVGFLSGCTQTATEKEQEDNTTNDIQYQDDDFADWVIEVYTMNGVYWEGLSDSLADEDFERGIETSDDWIDYLRDKLNEMTDYTILSEDMEDMYWDFSEVLTGLTDVSTYFKLACQNVLDYDMDGFNRYSGMLMESYDNVEPKLNRCKQVLQRKGYI
jgi:hypothetical protein